MNLSDLHLKLPLHANILVGDDTFRVLNARVYQGWQDFRRWRWEEWQLQSSDGVEHWLSYSTHEGLLFLKKVSATQLPPKTSKTIPFEGIDYRITDSINAKCVFDASVGRAPLRNIRSTYLTADTPSVYLSLEFDEEGTELFTGRQISEALIEVL